MPEPYQSVASNRGETDGQAGLARRTFLAPATEELGGEVTVAVLASGAGRGGEEASHLAADMIRQHFLSTPTIDVFQAISNAIQKANSAVRDRKARDPQRQDFWCSVSIAVVAGERLFVGAVGDNRVYVARRDDIKTLVTSQIPPDEELRAWQPPTGTTRDRPVPGQTGDYVGKQETVRPRFGPVEMLWPGDTIILCTDGVASQLQDQEIRDIVASRPIEDATQKLVDVAADRGSPGNLTALLMRVPAEEPAYAAPPMTKPGGLRLSPLVSALILGNLLLFCLVAAAIVGGGGSILSPQPPAEVAMPAFESSPTPGLDVGDAVPTLPGGGAGTPAAAPSATPAPTFTLQPQSATWTPSRPPTPLLPLQGAVFRGPEASVILSWSSVGALPEDIFYVVTIRKWINGQYVGESINWTKSTRIRLDTSFYTARNTGPGRIGMAAPLQAGAVNDFEWFVTLYRLTSIQPDGTLEGVPLTTASPPRHFQWGPSVPAQTPIYGGRSQNADPFIAETRYREASVLGALTPISAGMGLLSIVLGGIIARPKVSGRLRRLLRSRERS